MVFSTGFGMLFFDESLAATTAGGLAIVLVCGVLLWVDARREGDVRAKAH